MEYSTKELSKETWGDFEKLFRKSGEWEACWCMHYHRAKPISKEEIEKLSIRERIDRNRGDHKSLVDKGLAHGILVFDKAKSDPVG